MPQNLPSGIMHKVYCHSQAVFTQSQIVSLLSSQLSWHPAPLIFFLLSPPRGRPHDISKPLHNPLTYVANASGSTSQPNHASRHSVPSGHVPNTVVVRVCVNIACTRTALPTVWRERPGVTGGHQRGQGPVVARGYVCGGKERKERTKRGTLEVQEVGKVHYYFGRPWNVGMVE